jgi:Escherichia/Staphylococcus phage prohead protease
MEYSQPIPFQSFETKALIDDDSDAWIVEGFASTYDKDLSGDVVVPGAFRKSLAAYPTPALCWNHDFTGVPLGIVVACEERAGKGLWFRAELPKEDHLAREIVAQMKRGELKGISIGYKTIRKETRPGATLLKEIALMEISFCPRPMNERAQITSVKSFNSAKLDVVERALEEFEQVTRDMRSLARRVRGR